MLSPGIDSIPTKNLQQLNQKKKKLGSKKRSRAKNRSNNIELPLSKFATVFIPENLDKNLNTNPLDSKQLQSTNLPYLSNEAFVSLPLNPLKNKLTIPCASDKNSITVHVNSFSAQNSVSALKFNNTTNQAEPLLESSSKNFNNLSVEIASVKIPENLFIDQALTQLANLPDFHLTSTQNFIPNNSHKKSILSIASNSSTHEKTLSNSVKSLSNSTVPFTIADFANFTNPNNSKLLDFKNIDTPAHIIDTNDLTTNTVASSSFDSNADPNNINSNQLEILSTTSIDSHTDPNYLPLSSDDNNISHKQQSLDDTVIYTHNSDCNKLTENNYTNQKLSICESNNTTSICPLQSINNEETIIDIVNQNSPILSTMLVDIPNNDSNDNLKIKLNNAYADSTKNTLIESNSANTFNDLINSSSTPKRRKRRSIKPFSSTRTLRRSSTNKNVDYSQPPFAWALSSSYIPSRTPSSLKSRKKFKSISHDDHVNFSVNKKLKRFNDINKEYLSDNSINSSNNISKSPNFNIPNNISDSIKPREERNWDEFFPLLNLDLPILVKNSTSSSSLDTFDKNNSIYITDSKSINGSEVKLDTIVSSTTDSSDFSNINSDLNCPPNTKNINSKKIIQDKTPRIFKERGSSTTNNNYTTVLSIKNESLSLPIADYTLTDSFLNNDNVRIPQNHYIRYIDLSNKERLTAIEYDLDELDYNWLKLVSKNISSTDVTLTEDLMESVLDFLEKEWFDLTRDIQNQMSQKNLANLAAEDAACSICGEEECDNSNAIVFCDGCNLAVHQDCYGIPYIPEGQWLCRKCMLSPGCDVSCIFCPHRGGAFKKTTCNQWAHLMCALWIPEVGISNTVYMEPIDSVNTIPKSRWKLACSICGIRDGACIQCSVKNCYTAFHVQCAFKAHLYMKMKVYQNHNNSMFNIFCCKHTPPDHLKTIDLEAPRKALGILPKLLNENISNNSSKVFCSPTLDEKDLNSTNKASLLKKKIIKKPRGRPKKNVISDSYSDLSSNFSLSLDKTIEYGDFSPSRKTSDLISAKNCLTTSQYMDINSNYKDLSSQISIENNISSDLSLILTSKIFSLDSPVINHYIFDKLMNFLESCGMCNKFNLLKQHWTEIAKLLCKYWSLKRKQRNGAPLIKRLYLEPWTYSSSWNITPTSTKSDDIIKIESAHSNLVILRALANDILTREKFKAKIINNMVAAITAIIYPLKNYYLEILDIIDKRDKLGTFSKPVSLDEAPYYCDIIKKPMDLTTIRKKVHSFDYSNLKEFESDLMLVFNNCITYNENKSYHNNLARRLLSVSKDLMDNLRVQCQLLNINENQQYPTLPVGIYNDFNTLDPEQCSQTSNNINELDSNSENKSVDYYKKLGTEGLKLGCSMVQQQWQLIIQSTLLSNSESINPIPDSNSICEKIYNELKLKKKTFNKRKALADNDTNSKNVTTKKKKKKITNNSNSNLVDSGITSETRKVLNTVTASSNDTSCNKLSQTLQILETTKISKSSEKQEPMNSDVMPNRTTRSTATAISKDVDATRKNPINNIQTENSIKLIGTSNNSTDLPSSNSKNKNTDIASYKQSNDKEIKKSCKNISGETNKHEASPEKPQKPNFNAKTDILEKDNVMSTRSKKINLDESTDHGGSLKESSAIVERDEAENINSVEYFYRPKAKKIDGKYVLSDDSPAIFRIPTHKWPIGTLVWASMPSFPWFPAEIFDHESRKIPQDVHKDRKNPEKNCVLVYFYDVQLTHRTWKWLSPYNVLKLGADKELDEQLKLARTARSSSSKKQVIAAYNASTSASGRIKRRR
ncbi:hypothetical protein BB561_002305 [Smittium simulii]|uniref:Histone acetyltransferase n=1 Tax=Smittium simulii TaxID=133385 RepID=A0A2T9YQW4_9FUNG|nr:hypothetical protein BB561_002305 [Smittium simulii]